MPNKTYLISIKSTFEPTSGLHYVQLILNGFDDLTTSLNYFNPFENSQLVIGQYKTLPPFIGRLQSMLLFLYPLPDTELRKFGDSNNYDVASILQQTRYFESMQSFVQETHVPEQPLQGMTLSGKFFDRLEEVKQLENAEEGNEEEDAGLKGHELLYQFWNESCESGDF